MVEVYIEDDRQQDRVFTYLKSLYEKAPNNPTTLFADVNYILNVLFPEVGEIFETPIHANNGIFLLIQYFMCRMLLISRSVAYKS